MTIDDWEWLQVTTSNLDWLYVARNQATSECESLRDTLGKAAGDCQQM